MKKLLSILFSLFFLISSCKKKVSKKANASTASKNVSVLEKEFVIKGLNSVSHKVWLYLPPNYETSTERFPLIYMHGGQNLFDKKLLLLENGK
jgi:predicted peptidase